MKKSRGHQKPITKKINRLSAPSNFFVCQMELIEGGEALSELATKTVAGVRSLTARELCQRLGGGEKGSANGKRNDRALIKPGGRG